MMIDAAALLGTHDVLFVTLDTLRHDVAQATFFAGETPHLAALLPPDGWERRHSPASFTYAAHCAFFAGFLPTPTAPREANPQAHRRLFATRFPGSETSGDGTLVFDAADIVTGFSEAGYRTICIGGVGFFNKRSALGRVLPSLFTESFWEEKFGVTNRDSAVHQIACARERLAAVPPETRAFLFINISALHQPNCHYIEGATVDTADSQRAALAHVDAALGPLFAAAKARAPTLLVICADHGTAYGEDGYSGHRIGHPTVWDVPYHQMILTNATQSKGSK